VKRARELRQQDLISQAELDGAELTARQAAADLTSAKAAARAARAALAQSQLDRSHTVIRAPIDGIVVNRTAEVGQTLASRLQAPVLFRIADLRKMQMLTDVSEAEVGSVRPGAAVTFQIESLGPQQFHGTVAEVRLQPMYESGATGTSGATPPAGTVGTTGTAGASTSGTTGSPGAGTSSASTSSAGTQAAGSSGTATQPGSSTSSTASQNTSTALTPPAGAVVSYTAIVNVDNSDQRIAPGTTAIVTLPTAQRRDVLRVPNNALAFRPSPEMLEATVQASASALHATADQSRKAGESQDADPTRGRAGYVWKFENGKFLPVEVRAGASDETWTEILSGSVQPGDRLVTSATVARNVP
jgi:HlyD family secretion protein